MKSDLLINYKQYSVPKTGTLVSRILTCDFFTPYTVRIVEAASLFLPINLSVMVLVARLWLWSVYGRITNQQERENVVQGGIHFLKTNKDLVLIIGILL